jgi:hypothetical protein
VPDFLLVALAGLSRLVFLLTGVSVMPVALLSVCVLGLVPVILVSYLDVLPSTGLGILLVF